jgi:nucleoside-diphosphate-sugar epimerase
MPQRKCSVIVLGSNGLLGRDLLEYLLSKNNLDVRGYDYPEIDVTIQGIFLNDKPKSVDVVVCAFGLNHHIKSDHENFRKIDSVEVIESYCKVNLYGLKNVFDYFLELNKATKFIHYNSMYSREIPNPLYYRNEIKSIGYILSKTSAGALLKYYAVLHPEATFIDFIIGAVENNQPDYFRENFMRDLIRKELLEPRVVSEFAYNYIKMKYVTGCVVDITGGKL